ncbi:hypothetical protein D3P09_04035 [Paenibacillus pinisoli]|uniref:Fibronectin type-III domain-containing protein n=1 Tax=Paenibacillus pinisoli TaxID=1276110 RepID=A0A3A6Q369_9BACL|nr:hypothetical protein D3P09_04035 [Paenibacillus pinisoli]
MIGPCGDGPGSGGGDTVAPSAPSGLVSTAATSSSISLSWGASTDNVGVTGYIVYYGASSVNVTGTTAAISGLSPNTSYTFTVKARDAAGNLSAASNALQVSTTEGTAGPTSWVTQKSYVAGDTVTYAGKTYLCLQPHTSLTGWEPPNVPALWRLQ